MLDEYPTANFEYREVENGFTYTANAEKIRQEGHLIDYGHGQQVALPVTDWRVEPLKQVKLIWAHKKNYNKNTITALS